MELEKAVLYENVFVYYFRWEKNHVLNTLIHVLSFLYCVQLCDFMFGAPVFFCVKLETFHDLI